jgi:glucose-1-phosphate thymidylyltransferase
MITDYWKDTGTPEDIINANGTILEHMKPYFSGTKDDTVKMSGNTMIGKETQIRNNSVIVGPVIIGKNCIIDSARIGPNVSIGDNSNMSKCEISESIVMSNCNIDSKIKIKNSIIAFNSTIISNNEEGKNHKTFLLGEGTKVIL